MKCIELNIDGIRYFVTVKKGYVNTISNGAAPSIDAVLNVNSLRSDPIFSDIIHGKTTNDFTKKDAKKFVLRSLSVTK